MPFQNYSKSIYFFYSFQLYKIKILSLIYLKFYNALHYMIFFLQEEVDKKYNHEYSTQSEHRKLIYIYTIMNVVI